MKKNLFIVACAVVALGMTSCDKAQKNEETPQVIEEMQVTDTTTVDAQLPDTAQVVAPVEEAKKEEAPAVEDKEAAINKMLDEYDATAKKLHNLYKKFLPDYIADDKTAKQYSKTLDKCVSLERKIMKQKLSSEQKARFNKIHDLVASSAVAG